VNKGVIGLSAGLSGSLGPGIDVLDEEDDEDDEGVSLVVLSMSIASRG
jgi:hypothetical protein